MHLFCTGECQSAPRELEERLEKLERLQKNLELEWTDVLEKVNRTLGRIAKRQQAIDRIEAQNAEEEPPALSVHRDVGNATHTGMLTAKQKEVQQQILRRRAGG